MEKSERYVMIGIEEDQKWVPITAYIKAWINRLDKIADQYPNMVKHVREHLADDNSLEGKEYLVDKKLITPTSIKTPKKKLSEEEKQVVVNRLQKTRKPREKKVKIAD